MAKQKIKIGASGSTAMRVLEALTPVDSTVVPAINAEFIGQIYVDKTTKAAFMAVAVGSTVKAQDWQRLTPLEGTAAPAINSEFIGQAYIDKTNKAVYIAVATGSETPANDWQKMTAAV